MEAGEEKGGWESGFFFLIFTDIEKMGWDTKRNHLNLRPNQHETNPSAASTVRGDTKLTVADTFRPEGGRFSRVHSM